MIYLIVILLGGGHLKTELSSRGCMPSTHQDWVKEYQGRLNCIVRMWPFEGSLDRKTSQSFRESGT